MAEMTLLQRDITAAREFLEGEGFVVLRAKSYRAAQERQRVAEALLHSEVENAKSAERWAHRAFESQREAWDRTTYLYGLAASLGATDEQLHHARIDWPDHVTNGGDTHG